MLRTILLVLCASLFACTPPSGEEYDRGFKDIVPPDHQEEVDHVAVIEDRIGNWNPWKLLPPSPITWETCACVEGDHPCNIQSTDHNGDPFGLYALYGRPIVLDFSASFQVGASQRSSKSELKAASISASPPNSSQLPQ